MVKNTKLKRSLGLPLVTLYGLGNILGAGIYVLVGKVAGYAGTSTLLSFLIAMLVASLTAFSYMELAGRYPVSASVSVYLHKAFGKRWLSLLIGLAMVAGGVASAAALSQGFAGYLGAFFAVPKVIASVGLLVVLGLIAIKGIGESAKTAAVLTLVEAAGLVLIIWYGRSAITSANLSSFTHIDPLVGISGVFAGAFLAFYAFIGFEDMVNIAEEVKNPRRTMPLAILFALLASTALYLLVVLVSTTVVSPADLAKSNAPLAVVFERSGGQGGLILAGIGMMAAVNGVIVQIIMGSRIMYGLAKQGWVHSSFSRLHNAYKTPYPATLFVLVLMILATLMLPLVSLAQITSLLVLSIFLLVNVSLVIIKRRSEKHNGYISVPQIVPYSGAFLCGAMIVYQAVLWSL
ncbi:MAG TPA: amino acid permease [Candidatus Saccharibacteria bacterium]|nr:amino acid permease [Candidatus Saccharibacteria bacterium]